MMHWTYSGQSNSKHSLKGRSIVFPGYSFMNMMIKMMNSDFEAPNNQSKEAFEIELVSNFLQETTFQQYHHCRALAMKADVLRRTGRYEEAIASIDIMYNPRVHSRIILEEYASEHCADMLASSIYWLHYLVWLQSNHLGKIGPPCVTEVMIGGFSYFVLFCARFFSLG